RHTRFKCDWSSDVCSSDLNSSIVYVSDGCCSAAWLVALSALRFPNETGSLCVCAVKSVQLVPLPVRNSVEVVAVLSRFICCDDSVSSCVTAIKVLFA